MAGIERDTPVPTDIRLHRKSRILELCYADGERFELGCEFLRVFTPSAEARGHGPGQETLQIGKRDVDILRIEPVGNYAIRPVFSEEKHRNVPFRPPRASQRANMFCCPVLAM